MLDIIYGDLFNANDSISLAHCVSRDFVMSKGIASTFKLKFGNVDYLKSQNQGIGSVAILPLGSRFIYYLITKEYYWNKPTYFTLQSSLWAMKEHCIQNKVKQLGMPMIGCGLDRLHWDRVKNIIEEVFQNTNINIIVYVYNQNLSLYPM